MDKNTSFKPFVPANTNMKEFTLRAVLIGVILAAVLGAANAYLGLKAGMTIAATYPAAVIGMAVLKLFKGSILEENIARTIGSIGESVAAGAIFTLPAFYIAGVWNAEQFTSWQSYLTASLILAIGGILGIMFVALLRRAMVEDKDLPFPESIAAAEIHKNGQSGSSDSKFLLYPMIAGALINLCGALKLFATSAQTYWKTGIAQLTTGQSISGGFLATAPKISPAFTGVGFIVGPKLAAKSFSGGLIAWGLLVPILLGMMGSDFINGIAQAKSLDPNSAAAGIAAAESVWQSVVRIIAIGGLLVAACYTLYNMRGSLSVGLKRSLKDLKKSSAEETEEVERTEKDLKGSIILLIIGICTVATFCITLFIFKTSVLVAIVSALLVTILAFFFSATSGYLVGVIGSSNNPVSGLTVTALVVTALILVLCGVTEETGGVAAVIGVAALVCVAAAVGGEMFQDLKAGHILGGTPWKMQIGDIIGVIVASFVMFGVLIILNQADINIGLKEGYQGGFGSKELSAPQAFLMAVLSKAIVSKTMTWILIIAGMLFCFALILMGVKNPMLIFVGMYLPFQIVFAIFVGGLIKCILDNYVAKRQYTAEQSTRVENTGTLMASGLIAGEALMGLIIAVFAFFNNPVESMLPIENPSYIIGLIILIIMAYYMISLPLKQGRKISAK